MKKSVTKNTRQQRRRARTQSVIPTFVRGIRRIGINKVERATADETRRERKKITASEMKNAFYFIFKLETFTFFTLTFF